MKRVIAILLTVVLALAMSVTAFAADRPYTLTTDDITKGASGVSGTGSIAAASGDALADELYIRVAVVYENTDGEQILVVNLAQVKDDGTFKVPSTQAPYGYSVKTVGLVGVTSDAAALTGAWASCAVTDIVRLSDEPLASDSGEATASAAAGDSGEATAPDGEDNASDPDPDTEEAPGTQEPTTSGESGTMVWIPTNGGTKYHSDEDCSGMKDPQCVTVEYAISMGYTACKKCYG